MANHPTLSDFTLNELPENSLVYKIAKFIDRCNFKHQPSLSIGAALCAVGTIKAHRVQTETGGRTNLFCMGIADSGSGKQAALDVVDRIFYDANISELISGVPASDSGIIRLLADRKGKALILWDEIGYALKCITNEKSSSHEKKILSALMEIYTKSKTTYRGKEYANAKLNESFLIHQPCLSIWGATTPDKFYESLTIGNAADGFLPRWLLFPILDPDAKNENFEKIKQTPDNILEDIYNILSMPTNVDPQGNIDAASQIKPLTVPYTEDAKGHLIDIEDDFQKKLVKERELGTGMYPLYTRAYDMTCRVALIVSNDVEITETDLVWAWGLVNDSLNYAVFALKNYMHENEFSKHRKEYLDYILSRPVVGVTLSDLSRKFKAHNARYRQEIIQQLVDSNLVTQESHFTQSKNKKVNLFLPVLNWEKKKVDKN